MPLNDAATSLVGPVQNPWNTGGSGSAQPLPGNPQVSSGNPYTNTSGPIGGYNAQTGQQAMQTAQGRNDPGQRNVLQQSASGNLTSQRETVRQQYPGSYFSPNGDLMVPEGGNTFGQTTYRIINNGAVNETARTLALQQNNPYQGTLDLMRNETVQNQQRAQQQYERVDAANGAALQGSREQGDAIRQQSQAAGQEMRGERDAASARSEQSAAGVRQAATLNTDPFYAWAGEAAGNIRSSVESARKAVNDFKDYSVQNASAVGQSIGQALTDSMKALYSNPGMDPSQREQALFNIQTTARTQQQQAQAPLFQQFMQGMSQLQMGLSQTQAQAGQQFNNLANSGLQAESQRTEFASRGATTSAQIIQQDIANRQAYNQSISSLEAAGTLQAASFIMNGLVGYAQALQNNPPPQLAIGAGLLQIASVEESGFGRVNMPSMSIGQTRRGGGGGSPYGGNPYGGDQYGQATPQQPQAPAGPEDRYQPNVSLREPNGPRNARNYVEPRNFPQGSYGWDDGLRPYNNPEHNLGGSVPYMNT